MDERDFQEMQSPVPQKATDEVDTYPASMCDLVEFLNEQLAPKITPAPSWYDIYRYATDESEWYEKERTRLVAAGAKLDAIEEAVRLSNFFDEIREVADIQMMNVCLQIAKANEIENPFADFQDQPEKNEQAS